MAFYEIRTEKEMLQPGGTVVWSNSYTVDVAGGIDGEPLRSLMYWLALAEQQIHLQGVMLMRFIVRALPYSSPTDTGFRAFGAFGRELCGRPVPAGAVPLPLNWALHVKKQCQTGRSGHLAYRGVLHSCDVTVTPYKRLGLRTDSDLCGARWQGFRGALLDLWPSFVVPGPDADLAMVSPQRNVNGFYVGGPQNAHGRKVIQQYTKPKCLSFRRMVEAYRVQGARCVAALDNIPVTIEDEYLVKSVRHVLPDIFGLIEGGRDVLDEIASLNEPPNDLGEKEKCKFSSRALSASSVLSELANLKEAWMDANGYPVNFLGTPPDNKPKIGLGDVREQAAKVASVWDFYCHRLGFDRAETLLHPKPQDLLSANLARGSEFRACDVATQEYFDGLREWPTRAGLRSQFKAMLLSYGRKKVAQLTQQPPAEDYGDEVAPTLAEWEQQYKEDGESLRADPVMAAVLQADADAFIAARRLDTH
jgi:hypothetical protein